MLNMSKARVIVEGYKIEQYMTHTWKRLTRGIPFRYMRRDNRVTNPESETGMQVRLIPGPYDEEKVATVCQVHNMADVEQWEEFVLNCAEDEAWLDALCHAAGIDGVHAMQEQERYFHDLLLGNERNHFAARIGRVEI